MNNIGLLFRDVKTGVSRNLSRHTLWSISIVIRTKRSIQFTLISEIESMKYKIELGCNVWKLIEYLFKNIVL